MEERRVGFVVIYRWKVKPGMEAQYQRGWAQVTLHLKAARGALGSRLHKMDDDTWVAYAQWPSRAAWERSRTMGPADPEGSRLMREAEAEAFPPMLLEPVLDHLEPLPIQPGG
jgi:heme-degrading monooxygenase HmoA